MMTKILEIALERADVNDKKGLTDRVSKMVS